uniref:Uncharacterized protein n=1 Tax=Anopheles merus TaxID=30066 RepID=A0A182VIJ5_ANOME
MVMEVTRARLVLLFKSSQLLRSSKPDNCCSTAVEADESEVVREDAQEIPSPPLSTLRLLLLLLMVVVMEAATVLFGRSLLFPLSAKGRPVKEKAPGMDGSDRSSAVPSWPPHSLSDVVASSNCCCGRCAWF